MEALEIHRLVMAIALAAVRLGAAFMLCPPLAESMIGGTARRCAILGFSLLAVPLVLRQMPPGEPALLVLGFASVKEALVGAVIGFFSAIPFWVAEHVGNFIDNQRGATIGEVYSPLSGMQVSTTGIFFTQVVSTIFFVSGAVFLLLSALYESYSVWPVFGQFVSFVPDAPQQILGALLGVAMLVIYLQYIMNMLMYTKTMEILGPAMRLLRG